MKKLLLLLFLCVSISAFSQSFRTIVIEWDDTVTVRDVSKLNTYRVVNSNFRVNSLPVLGLDPNLEIFVYRQLTDMPPVDYRLYNVLVSEGCIDSLDSEWVDNRIYARQFEIISRDSTDLFEAVTQEESTANQGVFPYEKQLKYMALYMMIHRRETQGLNISPNQQLILDRVEAKGELIWQNHINANNKKKAIRDEENYDLDFGWSSEDPE